MTEMRNRGNRREGETGTEECREVSSDSIALRERLAELMKDDPVLNPFKIPAWYSAVPVLLWAFYVLCLSIMARFCTAEWRPGVTFDPDTHEAAFRVSHIIHGATMVAFIVTLMMAGIAYFWLLNPFKGIFSLTVTYISAVALTTYTFLLIYGVPGAWTTGSQRFEPVRFLEWLFTTPGMIFAIGCLTRQGLQSGMVSKALLADMLMISFGFMDRFCEPPFRQVFFLASMASFIATFYYFQILFGYAEGVLVDQTDRDSLKCLHRFTIGVWSLFPMVRLLSLFGYLGDEAEDMYYTGLDVASKLVYACSLMVVNFTVFNQVIEHRLNRTRQILQQQQQQLKNDNENEKNFEALGSVEQAYELKVLAYSEARAWKEERHAIMMSQGYPSNRAAALLDSTLTEYIELSSGNLSCYLQG